MKPVRWIVVLSACVTVTACSGGHSDSAASSSTKTTTPTSTSTSATTTTTQPVTTTRPVTTPPTTTTVAPPPATTTTFAPPPAKSTVEPAYFCSFRHYNGSTYYIQYYYGGNTPVGRGVCSGAPEISQSDFTNLDLRRQCILADNKSIKQKHGIVSYYSDSTSGSVAAAKSFCR